MKQLFIRRALAYLCDVALVFFFLFVLPQTAISTFAWPALGVSRQSFESGLFTEIYTVTLISLPIWLYFILFDRSGMRGTPGKKLLGLIVVDAHAASGETRNVADDDRITLGQSIIRNALKLLPWESAHLANNIPTPLWYDPNPAAWRSVAISIPTLIMAAYIIYCLARKGRSTLHDLAAKTQVAAILNEVVGDDQIGAETGNPI